MSDFVSRCWEMASPFAEPVWIGNTPVQSGSMYADSIPLVKTDLEIKALDIYRPGFKPTTS